MKKISDYMNGNVHITLYDNGTRIMDSGEDDHFDFAYPTNTDITITKKCDGNCPWCYLGCTKNGEHADLMSWKFFDTIPSGIEMAINLNDMSHPQLEEFLLKMKNKSIFVNGTINEKHFLKHYDIIKKYADEGLLHGVGISLTDPTDEFIDKVSTIRNAVVHIVNGLFTKDDYIKTYNKNLKLLILGYKDIGRGYGFQVIHQDEIKENQDFLYSILPVMMLEYDVISFDNLAIEQLKIKDFVSKEEWDRLYQGDDGTSTFAIDLVDGTFSRNSMERNKKYPISNSITDMFDTIKKERLNDLNKEYNHY